MIEQREDISATEYVYNLVNRQEWVDEEILMIYEQCYRLCRSLMIANNEDTTNLDETRNEIMRTYDQL
jgi:hypothetical protein